MIDGKTRFAPSPTGLIHLGNARTALFNRLFGKTFLLRIEDTDRQRSRPEFVAALFEDLRWLQLDWDEGPESPEPDEYFQSRRTTLYAQYYNQLEQLGLAYPCFCSPEELAAARTALRRQGKPPRYPGTCAHLPAEAIKAKLAQGLRPTLRFRVPRGRAVIFNDLIRGQQRFATDDIGDFIIRRADGTPAFFFCNAVDDALMGVTHVLRGEDHLTNTPRQLLILEALGLPAPQYGHMALILGTDGAPLSKRNGSRSIQELRRQGYLPGAVLNFLARLGHTYPEEKLYSLQQLAAGFELRRLSRSPARFDPAQLDHWQKKAVQQSDDTTLWQWLDDETRSLVPENRRHSFLMLVRNNWLFPGEARQWAKILFADPLEFTPEAEDILSRTESQFFQCALTAAQHNPTDYQAFLAELKRTAGVKGKRLFQPLRAALSGRLDGPELERIYALLGPDRILTRLSHWT